MKKSSQNSVLISAFFIFTTNLSSTMTFCIIRNLKSFLEVSNVTTICSQDVLNLNFMVFKIKVILLGLGFLRDFKKSDSVGSVKVSLMGQTEK